MSPWWQLSLEQLESRGDAAALRSVDEVVSYRQLARRAARLVAALRSGGVAVGEPVALLFAVRGHAEPVGLAGTLCAAGVVVPLDPHNPVQRLRDIAVARGCRALVHDGASRALAQAVGDGMLRLEIDERGRLVGQSEAAPGATNAAPDLACILHTSGTTGVPKAVPIGWAGLDAFTKWMVELTQLGPGDGVLRVAELIFDLAWFDHLATWRAGATLATVERRALASARSLAASVDALRPQVIYGVPAFFTKLVAGWAPDAHLPPELRVLCFAGEVFPPRDLLALAQRSGDARLVNLFGPTETNVCTFHEVDRGALDGQSELPIGIAPPYAECTLRAEDGGGLVVGAGTGELVVAGPTALGGCFATGDRVERKADGLFYFRGRLDRMIKIRGYRVQPAEVEAALRADPRLQEVAVTVSQHPRLGPVLQAHVVARDTEEAGIEPQAIRARVAARLPPYMVPQRVELRSALPRTSTGKIDYASLQAG